MCVISCFVLWPLFPKAVDKGATAEHIKNCDQCRCCKTKPRLTIPFCEDPLKYLHGLEVNTTVTH